MKISKILMGPPILGWSLILLGCTDFVQVGLPPSQLTGQAIFADRTTATAAIANIYGGLRDQTLISGSLSGMGSLLGHYSDELEYFGTATGYIQDFSNHSILATNSQLAGLWRNSYNLVYACNSVLEGLDGNTAIAENERERLLGEALFLRSFIHFYLTQLFGDIPYVTKTDYNQNAIIGKSTTGDILSHLIADLEEASNLLPEEYVDPGRVRVNKFAAMAFLARVQLYSGNWEVAQATANIVLNRTDIYHWEVELDKVFLKDSQSTIWQLRPNIEGINTAEASTFIFSSGPPPNGALSQSFMIGFESNDLRRVYWTRGITEGNNVWYHPFKYKENNNTGTSKEYSVVLRLGELYLIRAEARIHLGNLDGAVADLNKIRQRAGLPVLEGLDKETLETAILKERRYELFTEYGHRWFDLKRFQKASAVLAPLKSNWKETDLLFPIPELELLINPNLKPQNNGY